MIKYSLDRPLQCVARLSLALVLVCSPLVLAPSVGAQVVPIDNEFQVNTYTTESQNDSDVAIAANGDFVVVWESSGQDDCFSCIFLQRFASDATPLGDEFAVNSITSSNQAAPTVGVHAATGNFVVAWQNYGLVSAAYEISAQRYDSGGTPLGAQISIVNTYTTFQQEQPEVFVDAAGDFVVVWHSHGPDGGNYGISGQRFDSSGDPIGGEFVVNTYTTNGQRYPAIDGTADGAFVVVWQSFGQDGHYLGVFGQRHDSSGVKLGSEFQVNTFTTNTQGYPDVGVDPSGRFVVAWESYAQDGDDRGSFAQAFDSFGAPVGGEFMINTFTTSNQDDPAVTSGGDDVFVVAWKEQNVTRAPEGGATSVVMRAFDGSGAVQGQQFVISSAQYGNRYWPAITSDNDSKFVVSWNSNGQGARPDGGGGGPGAGIFARRLGVDTPFFADGFESGDTGAW